MVLKSSKILLTLSAVVFVTSASADDASTCSSNGLSADARLTACTHALKSKQPPETSAFLYVNRGLAYAAKDDNEHAIADYTEAIHLAPDNAQAFLNRGVAYALKRRQ